MLSYTMQLVTTNVWTKFKKILTVSFTYFIQKFNWRDKKQTNKLNDKQEETDTLTW